jgi:hypothetical protein
LIVDEAQNLPVSALEELRMLPNFQCAGKALLQIVLLGQPEFRDKLSSPGLEQLRQRVIATHHLDAMAADEVEAYIGHRLTLVGWQGRPDFAPGALAAIHAESGGIPRRVNQIANRLLLHAAVEGVELIDADAVAAVVADLAADVPPPARAAATPAERVLPLRAARLFEAEPQPEPAPSTIVQTVPVADPAQARRIAALEAKVEEQEAALRRVLTLLVDWIENPEPKYRSHAA